MLMMSVYEKPVDTAQDVLDRGMIPFTRHTGEIYIEILEQSLNPAHQQLAEIFYLPKSNAEFYKTMEALVFDDAGSKVYLIPRTHAFIGAYQPKDLDRYRSKEVLQCMAPWQGWVVNKIFPLKEDLAAHLLRFQQVCL